MAMAYNTLSAIPRLLSYEQASRWERDTKPIRGDANGTKPLGRRTQKYIQIKREEDDNIALIYGNHVFARYEPSGNVMLYDQGYSVKAAVNELLERVTGLRTWTDKNKCWVRVDGKSSYLRSNPRARWVYEQNAQGEMRHRRIEDSNPLPRNIFRRTKDARGMEQWTYINPPTLVKHVINRAGKKRVMETYAPFMRYLDAMTKVMGDSPAPELDEYVRVFDVNVAEGDTQWAVRNKLPPSPYNRWFNHEQADKLATLMGSDDIAHHYKAMLWLWVGIERHHNDHRKKVISHAHKAIMMTHHNEVLTKVEIETESSTGDAYLWAIPVSVENA
jgi:hypothetical protein